MAERFATVDEYLDTMPDEAAAAIREIRRRLHTRPGIGERISYQMPTFTIDGRPVVHVAGWKRHISLYPAPTGDAVFEQAIAPYRSGQSTLRFPLNQPVPYELIEQVVDLLAADRS